MREWRLHAETLMLDEKFYCVSADDITEGNILVNSLVKSDNLPSKNTLVGLVSLRTAWDEIDEADYNAGTYKRMSKRLFKTQLLLQMLTVWCTCMRAQQKVMGWDRRLSLLDSLGEPWTEGESCDTSAQRLTEVCPGLLPDDHENATRSARPIGLLELDWQLSPHYDARAMSDPLAESWTFYTVSQAAEWGMLPSPTKRGDKGRRLTEGFLAPRGDDTGSSEEHHVWEPSDSRRLSSLEAIAETDNLLTNLIFLLSLASTLVIAVTRYLNPTERWRHLRSAACHLESTIWRYRTRVGPEFEVRQGLAKGPDEALNAAIDKWRKDLFTGSDLQVTPFVRKYKENVYKHCQREGELVQPTEAAELGRPIPANGDMFFKDDHQSPTEPEAYVQLRLIKTMHWYQKRLPNYSTYRAMLTLTSILCTSISALLAYGQQTLWVAILSSITAAAVSWGEFADLSRKIERYSTAIRGIKAKIAWWDSLKPVERAAPSTIAALVNESEAIITSEFQAWNSLGGKDEKGEKGDDEDDGKDGGSKKAGSGSDKSAKSTK
jgi:hypothetical protein